MWPKYEQVSLRSLDLKVLQRHASSLGAQLGLVTRWQNVRREASALGIPVFESSAAAQKGVWSDDTQEKPLRFRTPRIARSDLQALRARSIQLQKRAGIPSGIRLVMFMLGAISVLAIAALFVPRAIITLYPQSQIQQAVIPVIANPDSVAISLAGEVPARTVLVEISGGRSAEVHGSIATPQGKAQGKIRFTNLTQSELEIPEGTVVSTMGDVPVRFRTLHTTQLPAGLDQIVEAPIEALFPGEQGNVVAEAIRGLEGTLGLSATVTNPEPTLGGSDVQAIGASDAERAELRNNLIEELAGKAREQMHLQLASEDRLLDETVKVEKVLEETMDPPEGRAGKTLSLNLRVEFTGQYLLAGDLQELALSTLDLSIPEGFSPTDKPNLEIRSTMESTDPGNIKLDLVASRILLQKVDLLEISELVRGQTLTHARELLSNNISSRAPFEIALNPGWWPWLPLIPFNINVIAR